MINAEDIARKEAIEARMELLRPQYPDLKEGQLRIMAIRELASES